MADECGQSETRGGRRKPASAVVERRSVLPNKTVLALSGLHEARSPHDFGLCIVPDRTDSTGMRGSDRTGAWAILNTRIEQQQKLQAAQVHGDCCHPVRG
jgi:hypothetical protein